MSQNNIPFLTRTQAPTPPSGHVTLFYDVDNGNTLTFKDSNGIFCALDQLPAPTVNVDAITECICEVVNDTSEKLACAASKGVITMSEFESYMQNFNMFSSVTIDPSTGSFVHGITSQPVLFVQLTTTNVLCNGDSTGTASAVISGGTAPYTQTWEVLGGGAANPAALAAGTYVLTVNDANNVTKVITFVITEPPALGLTVNVQDETANGANDGIASAVVTGGTPPYTYEWKDNLGTPIGQTTQTATGLAPGTYQVEVTDDNGCTIENLAVVIAPGP